MGRLDMYEKKPAGMEAYLAAYGWHFSKAMCEWAVSKMRSRNGIPEKMQDKNIIMDNLRNHKIEVKDNGYDAVYVYHMAHADYYGSSLTADSQLYKFVGDYLNDLDGYKEVAFTRFYADCLAKGIPIIWEDML